MAFSDPRSSLDMLPEFVALDKKPSPSPISDDPTRPYICPEPSCGRNFTRKKALQDHIQGPTHANIRPFKCKQCSNKRFTRVNDLKRHETEVHSEKKFVCQQVLSTGERWGCLKRFSRLNTLKQHQKDCASCKDPRLSSKEPKLPPDAHITWPSVPEAKARQAVRSRLRERTSEEGWTHEENDFVCKICGARRRKIMISSFVHHLLGHLEDIEFQAFQCAHCGVQYVLQEPFRQHRQACNRSTCPLIGDPLTGVSGCGRDFSTVYEFLRHSWGMDGSRCRHQSEELIGKLREEIFTQLLSLGLATSLEKYADFVHYIQQARKEASELS